MKAAQDFVVGDCFKVENSLFMVLKTTFSKSGRNASVMKLKVKNLMSGAQREDIYRATDKLEEIELNTIKMKYQYASGSIYTFQDQETWDEINLNEEDLGDAIFYIEDDMELKVVFFEGKPVGVELPTFVVREIVYTEPGAKGDTSGRVTKPAKIKSGMVVNIPLFCEVGDNVRIDTRTGEYVERVQ